MKRVARLLGIIIGVLGVVFVVRELVRNWIVVTDAASGADPIVLVVAFVIGLASMTTIGLAWHRCLTLLGAWSAVRTAMRDYFVGQLGKYVPGGIWPVVGRSEMARRSGASGTVAYGSTALSLALTYLAAPLTAAGALLTGAGGGEDVRWQAIIALVPFAVAVLHPRVAGWALGALRRLSRREVPLPVPAWGTSIALLAWHVAAWIGIGTSTWLIAATLDPESIDLRNLLFATTLAWLVGFLAIGVPGGIGVREAVFIAAASSLSSTGVAAAVAVVARFMFIVVDLTGAALSALLEGRGSAGSRASA